jgi:DNA polymerase I-like protein with 3'-5' exonuclease and polymerase domains
MKQSLICFANIAEQLDLPYELHANVHDEVQFSCDSEHSEQLGQAFVDAIVQAGEELNFKCKLDGEYKVGNNWAETH